MVRAAARSFVAVAALVAGCGMQDPSTSPHGAAVTRANTTTTYTVGATLQGLAPGQQVVVTDNKDKITLSANGPFTFPTPLDAGTSYKVEVNVQPSSQTCSVAWGLGTLTSNVTNVVVTCGAGTVTVGGSVVGLTGSMKLQNTGEYDYGIDSVGPFTFSTPIALGAPYDVTVLLQPQGQTCVVTNGSGTALANVTDVTVTCGDAGGGSTGGGSTGGGSLTVGGTVQGLTSGQQVVLQDNGGDQITLSADGTFTFPTAVAPGGLYDVEVNVQPAAETCSVAYGQGTASAAVTNVVVTCSATTVTIGGWTVGLAGASGLEVQNTGSYAFGIDDWEPWTMTTAFAYGSPYEITVSRQPTGETCVVKNGKGIALGDVADVLVDCAPPGQYAIGGSVSGLSGEVVLENEGGDDVKVGSDGAFWFPTPIASGQPYAVTVASQPDGQTCTVTNDTGTVLADVTNVAVTCTGTTAGGGGTTATGPFTIGGVLQGLASGQQVLMQDNGGDKITLSADGPFTFPTALDLGATYKVEVNHQPSTETCTVAWGVGTVSGAVANVVVTCATTTVTIGGSVTGLTGSGMKLQNTGEYDYGVDNLGPFTFSTPIAFGAPYAVTVSQQPQGQTCTVSNGSGVAQGNVTDVAVTCEP